MQITASGNATFGPAFRGRTAVLPDTVEAPRTTLPAVVPSRNRCEERLTPRPRSHAALLAQLAAAAHDLPATRARRRADPAAGAEAYRAVARLGPPQPLESIRIF